MPGAEKGTAEEHFGRMMRTAQVLDAAAQQYAAEDDSVRAVACALGADLAVLESVVWERLNIAPRSPQRQFYQAVEAVSRELAGFADSELPDAISAEQLIDFARDHMVSAFESSLVFDLSQRWPDIEYLAAVLAPSADEIEMSVAERLGGLTTEEFVAARRAAAAAAILDAQARRVKGSIPEAIQAAYESDFLALEAYLVESAVAAGDTQLFTVTCRWELATAAMSELDSLPSDFLPAVRAIRAALVEGLGESDGDRLLHGLGPL